MIRKATVVVCSALALLAGVLALATWPPLLAIEVKIPDPDEDDD